MKITFGGNPITMESKMIKVGDKAIDFVATKQDLSQFKLSDVKGIKIISAAPSFDTSTCSLQAIRFNEEAEKLKDKVSIVSITVDLPFAQKRFCSTSDIDNMIVVSDYQKHDFGKKYGFLIEGLKLLTRGIVVVDENDVVRYVEYVEEVANEPDYEKVIDFIKTM